MVHGSYDSGSNSVNNFCVNEIVVVFPGLTFFVGFYGVQNFFNEFSNLLTLGSNCFHFGFHEGTLVIVEFIRS